MEPHFLIQVLLSTDGKIVGFQPTSRVAVNHWASNPLTKELYGGKKPSPGIPLLSYLYFLYLMLTNYVITNHLQYGGDVLLQGF